MYKIQCNLKLTDSNSPKIQYENCQPCAVTEYTLSKAKMPLDTNYMDQRIKYWNTKTLYQPEKYGESYSTIVSKLKNGMPLTSTRIYEAMISEHKHDKKVEIFNIFEMISDGSGNNLYKEIYPIPMTHAAEQPKGVLTKDKEGNWILNKLFAHYLFYDAEKCNSPVQEQVTGEINNQNIYRDYINHALKPILYNEFMKEEIANTYLCLTGDKLIPYKGNPSNGNQQCKKAIILYQVICQANPDRELFKKDPFTLTCKDFMEHHHHDVMHGTHEDDMSLHQEL